MKKIVLLFLICLLKYSYSQDQNFEFFPSGLNFPQLKASYQEARIGLNFIPENNNMKIDIGNSIDLLGYSFSESERLTAGIDFLAYALSRSYQGKRLQIDAVDGLFGGNISYSKKIKDNIFLMRCRIIHNSAHLVDGHWDFGKDRWIDNYRPVPYAKDFMELTIAYNYQADFAAVKSYLGSGYSFLIRPSDIKRLNFNCGVEAGLTKLFAPIIGKNNLLFFAHHFILEGTKNYNGTNNSMFGIKFGGWNEKGLLIFVSYFNGMDVFHSYYKRKAERFGIGFSIELL